MRQNSRRTWARCAGEIDAPCRFLQRTKQSRWEYGFMGILGTVGMFFLPVGTSFFSIAAPLTCILAGYMT